jgi:ribosomal protein S18 acetylase RimI-like enzyme
MAIRRATLDDAPILAHIRITSWRSAYAGLMPADFLAGQSLDEHLMWWQKQLSNPDPRTATFVMEDDVVFAFATVGPEKVGTFPAYPYEVYAIHVLPDAKRRGVGRLLMATVARHLMTNGVRSMMLWVLRDNTPARAFYEKLGGKVIAEQENNVWGTWVPEVAYGWDDLTGLAAEEEHS